MSEPTTKYNRNLQYACHISPINLRAAQAAVATGASLNQTDRWGNTPLLLACKGPDQIECIPLVKWILEQNSGMATLNVAGNNGVTPLMRAATKCNATLVQLLLEVGADPTMVNEKNGKRTMSLVRRRKYKKCVALIEEAEYEWNMEEWRPCNAQQQPLALQAAMRTLLLLARA